MSTTSGRSLDHRLGLGDRPGGSDDLDVGLPGEQRGQGVGEEPMVLDEQDPDPALAGRHGIPR